MQEQLDILGVHVAITNLDKAYQSIEEWIVQNQKAYVCVAPVSTIVDCQSDEQYHKIVNDANMTTPDGMPLVWIGKMKGKQEISRTYGPDLLLATCEKSQASGFKHYFYGGTPETTDLLVANLKKRFPKLNIVGHYSPPYRSIYEQEEAHVLDQINALKPDIIWVGLGAPKQDYWMAEHRDKLDAPVLIGVGAAFDFIAGTKPQAPRWMQRSGLEWLFRLGCEPKRLWKRYLVGNSKFLFLLIKDMLGFKGKRHT